MDSFFKSVSQFVQLSNASKDALTSKFKKLAYERGHLLVRPFSICNYLYFIESGLTRTFYYKDDRDVTDWISAENSFAVSVVSFLTRQPDRRGIEVLESSIIYAVHHDELESLCTLYHDVEKLVRSLLSLGLIQLQQKLDDLHFSSALDRYQNLLLNNPDFIQRVPLRMIASYLGMTQETLSRIRSQF